LLELRNAELAAAQAAAQRATAPQPAAPIPATPAPVAAPKPVVPAAAPAPASQPGALSEFIKDYGMVTVAVAALLLLLGLLAVRRARAQRADADLLAEAGDDEQLNADRYRRLESNTQPLRSPNIANIDNADPSFLVEETAQQLPVQEPARPVRQVVPVVAPVLVATPAIDLAADALQEADLYMAYGLFDQAAVMLRKSLAHEPTRRDLWLKLLEVCFVWGNKDAFCEAARELAKTRSESTAAEWDQILIMGRQLAPEDPLFAESVSAAASSGAVDLNLEGGHSRVDFDMFGQTQVDPQAQAVELDFSDVFDEKDAEATIVSDESLDFQFDYPQRGSDLLPEDTVTNLEPVLKLPVELDIALDDDEENGAAGHLDRTAELAIDDLDLGHMDPTDSQRIDDSRVARALESNVDLLEAELPPISDITGAWELPAAAPLAAQPAVAASVAAVEPTPVEPEPVDSASLSEVGTKLDLARAYIDMGDPEGARSIIEEVMLEGSAAQKQEGQRLLSTIPG
jgi:pilus assembly protein FimV